jgi:hypothetical protein
MHLLRLNGMFGNQKWPASGLYDVAHGFESLCHGHRIWRISVLFSFAVFRLLTSMPRHKYRGARKAGE